MGLQKRIRGRDLQAIRLRHLSRYPLCAPCLKKGRTTKAVEVDHIIPLHLHGEESSENRQSICLRCHHEKSARERGFNPRSEIGVDGWPKKSWEDERTDLVKDFSRDEEKDFREKYFPSSDRVKKPSVKIY